MTALSSFEVLSQLLVPMDPSFPYVTQAFFVQVSYPSFEGASTVKFDLTFEGSTSFDLPDNTSFLLAQYINEDGNEIVYPQFTSGSTPGFHEQQINPGKTSIYSVIVNPRIQLPPTGAAWRGIVNLNPSTANVLVATPTQRQIYYTGDQKSITDSVVYSVPTVSGGTRI